MAKRMSMKEVMLLKAMISQGHSQIDVSRAIGISAAHVNRIVLGDTHRDVPWPPGIDGSIFMKHKVRRDQTVIRAIQAPTLEPVVHPIVNSATLPTVEGYEDRSTLEMADEAERKAIDEEVARRMEKKRVMDMFNEMSDKIDEEDNLKYLEIVNKSGPPGVAAEKSTKTLWDVPFMDYDTLVEKAGDNPIVQALTSEQPEEALIRAVGIVFFNLAEEKWEDDVAINFIRDTHEKLLKSKRE